MLSRCLVPVLGVMATLAADASGFQFGSSHDYYDPPDFRQTRPALPWGGSNYCGPTSAADALQYLANNGWPALSPLTVTEDAAASEPASTDPPDVIQEWNDITDFIYEIAIPMETENRNGTSSARLIDGLEERFSVYDDAFYIRHEGRADGTLSSWERGASFDYALTRMEGGEVVLVNVGFYHEGDNERCGGHWMCLTGYSTNLFTGDRSVRLKDPARDHLSFSSHVVTTETVGLEEEDNFDVDGDGAPGSIVTLTADSWNWQRTISASLASPDCPQGDNRWGYQDNLVCIGESLLYGLSIKDFKVQEWVLGRDLFGPLHDIIVWDFILRWDDYILIYVDRQTGMLWQYDIFTTVSTPMQFNFTLDNIRQIEMAPNGTMMLTSLLDQGYRLLTVVSPQGQIMGQFQAFGPVNPTWWDGPANGLGGFLFVEDNNVMLATPGQGLSLLTSLEGAYGSIELLAVDERSHRLHFAEDMGTAVHMLDLQTLEPAGALALQAPCSDLAVGNPGWLYVASSTRTGVSVFHDGHFHRTINVPFTTGLAVTASSRGPLSIADEVTDPPWGPSDVNQDGLIGIEDLLLVIDQWGGPGQDGGDVDGSGLVGIEDLLLVIADWGN